MSDDTAKMIVIAITAVGALAWLSGLAMMLRATRERLGRIHEQEELFEVDSEPHAGAIIGGADVHGEPEMLSAKLAERLAVSGFGPIGPVKILARDRREVIFEPAGPSLGGSGFRFRRGIVRFAGSGTTTHVDYVVETSPRDISLIFGWITLCLGLIALVVVPWLQLTYVIPDPRSRTQVVQTIQMIHFIWPPFLFAHLSRQPGRILRAQMDALVHNLPYLS